MSSDKKITLKSSDGETFEVEETVALESETIKHMVEVNCADSVIPLPNVRSTILSKIIEYCKKHVEGREEQDDKSSEDELKKWDADFVNVDNETLSDLFSAACFLKINGLLDLIDQALDDMFEVKELDEVHKRFTISDDFTPEEDEDLRRAIEALYYSREEEEEVRRESQWAFTGMRNDIVGGGGGIGMKQPKTGLLLLGSEYTLDSTLYSLSGCSTV